MISGRPFNPCSFSAVHSKHWLRDPLNPEEERSVIGDEPISVKNSVMK